MHKIDSLGWVIMALGAAVSVVAFFLMAGSAFLELFFFPQPETLDESIEQAMPTWRVYTFVTGLWIMAAGSLTLCLGKLAETAINAFRVNTG